jgi:O-antigen ligase
MDSPIFGQGFGKTVTYETEDPRLVQAGNSQYTTYAFEWGYLDFLLKLGIFGLLAYLWLLYSILIYQFKKRGIQAGLGLGLLFLIIAHFFTPYLNHPLGIIYVIICSCLISDDKV